MYKIIFTSLLTVLLLSGCVVVPAHRDSGVVIAPALPVVVELGVEPYYYYSGYYYYYHNNRWSYANTRSGPWLDLPPNRYPKEIRYRGRGDDDRGNRGHDRD